MMRKILAQILLLSGLSLLSSQLRAQTDTPEPPKSDKVEINYARPTNYRIADIAITGGEGYDNAVLISLSGLNVGDLVEVPGIAFSDAVRRFMRNGYFDNARIIAKKIEGNQIWIEIQLKQRPKISQVTFTGVTKSERKDLEERTGLRAEMQLSPNIIDRTKQLVKKYFDEKGYSDMTVEVEQKNDLSKQNHALVTVVIDKKSKIKVSQIEFVGNKELSNNALRASMKKTNETFSLGKGRAWSSILEIFSQKKFIEKDYKEDLNNLLTRYHEAGYRDAEILSDTIVKDPQNPKRIKIQIKLDEGKKYYIKSLRFVGNTKYPTEYLNAMLGIKSGEIYNQKRLENRLSVDEDAVANLYYNNGYIFAHIDPIETGIVGGDSVNLDLRITEGPQATISKVLIKGNDLVYENVIRRELYTKPGKLFSKEDLMNSYMALNQLNQFDPEKSVPKPVPNTQDGTVDIEYNLEPKRSDKFEMSLGWSQAGLIASVGLSFTNFSMYNLFHPSMYKGIIPQGDGQTLSLNVSTNGRYYQQYGLTFVDPWFGGKRPNYFSASIFYSRQTALDTRFYNNKISSRAGGYNPYYGYGGYGYGGYGGYGNYGGGYGYDGSALMEKAYNPNQSLSILGGSIGYGKRLNWPDNWFMFYASLNYNYYHLNDWVYDTFEGFHNGSANDINLQLRFSRSSLDNPIYTRRGSEFSLSVTATPPYSLFDNVDYSDPRLSANKRYKFVEYHKWRFTGRVFTPLANPQMVQYTPVLMNRLDLGILGSYHPYKRSPFGTYYMGGDGMSGYVGGYMNETIGLRGYKNGTIAGSNYDYATAFMRLTTELRMPIVFQGQTNIWALAFIEAGNAWTNISDLNPFNLKRSAGLGVRITLPMVGLLGIDWGYGFDRPNNSTDRGGSNVHFVLNKEF